MRHVLGLLGVAAAAILLLVSASMNWSFGYSLGKSEFEAQLFGAASAAADTLKALLPFFIFGALRNRNRAQAAAGVLLMAVCFVYSLTSSLGFATVNRSDSTRARIQQTEKHQLLVTEGDRIASDLSQVNKELGQPIEIVSETLAPLADPISAQIEAYKQNVFWKTSAECANAPGKQSREYCQGYFELMAKRDAALKHDAEDRAKSLAERVKIAAERRTRLEDRRNDLEKQRAENLAKVSSEKKENAVGEADPQVELLASLVGATPDQMKKALPILVALLVEIGASLGFFVAFSYWRILEQESKPVPDPVAKTQEAVVQRPVPVPAERLRDRQPKNDVEMFFDERVAREEGQSVTALALYDDYCNWCDAKSKQPFGLPIFGRHLNELGVQKAKIAGRIRYIGVRMLFAEEDDMAREMAAAS